MGGDDDDENVVSLTPEEHYLAHLLLVKMYPSNYKLLWAIVRMMGSTETIKRNNKWYGWVRRRFVEEMSKPKSAETRRKMSEYWTEYRRTHPITDEMKQQMRERNLGKKHSDETRKKMSESHRGKPKSEEHKKKMSEARKGKPQRGNYGPEYVEKQRANMKRIWALRKQKNQEAVHD